ncbi:MAG: cyclase family protein [Gammaproteobacteria bacterium]|nr:cyclase family protein [Gammaproteobacteria bacterium]
MLGTSTLASAADKPAWCPSHWGAEDQIGAANRLTPALAAAAAGLVKKGRTYALGIETNNTTPAYGSRSFNLVILQPGQAGGAGLGSNKATYNDDVINGYAGIGSQIDGLGHVGIDNVYYNCNHNTDFVQPDGLRKLGVEGIPPIVTRGVMLDMTRHYGKDPVPGGTEIDAAAIKAQAAKQGIEIRTGDIVLIHTGWLAAHGNDRDAYLAAEPGVSLDGGEYLVSREVVAVGADNWGVEVSPNDPAQGAMPVHTLFLPRNGIYILETMNTAELARDEVYEFMFVLGIPKLTGGVQAIVNPIAID